MSSYTPADDANLLKAMEEAAAKAKAEAEANSAPPEKDKGASSPGVATGDKGNGEETGSVTNGTAPQSDKAPNAPDFGSAFDTSFLPESVRSKVHFDDDAAFAAVKNGYLAHAEATRKFQEASALKRDAENYRALVSDPDYVQAIAKVTTEKATGNPAPAPESEPELDPLDPNSVKTFIAKQIQVEKAKVVQEMSAPAVHLQRVNGAISAYFSDKGLDQAACKRCVDAVQENMASHGGMWTPEMVPILLAPYVAAERAKIASPSTPAAPPANKTAPVNGAPGLERVASPVGRNGPHQTQTIPFPKHFVNGEPPKGRRASEAELEEELLYAMRKRFGPDVTIEDVRRR